MLTPCPLISEWIPFGSTGETKTARKGTGHPILMVDGLGQCFLPVLEVLNPQAPYTHSLNPL